MKVTPFTTLFIVSILSTLTLFFFWFSYNRFIRRMYQIREDFADIDVQLKRRATLIEQLVAVVREYATHEKSTFESVTRARSLLDSSKTVQDVAQAENLFTHVLRSLFAVAENYPELKANESYKNLMDNLKDTEDRIASYRETYNTTVKKYNTMIETFPYIIAAKILGFVLEEFFSYQDIKVT